MKHETLKVVLVGQPNVGKSVVFGCLTGKYANVSNYPGTTVEVSKSLCKIGSTPFEIIDTPGLYSIFPITEEEKVTLKIIETEYPNLIVHVIDAKNIERMLPLSFQLIETKIPIIIAINMFDEANSLGITINTEELSKKLGCKVVATVAITNQGIHQLTNEIVETTKYKTEHPKVELPKFSDHLMKEWYEKSRNVCLSVVKKIENTRGLSKLDKIIISPYAGPVILAAILYFGLYKFVGVFGAGTLVNFLENHFTKYLNPWLTKIVVEYVPWVSVQDLFVGEYGILTLGIRYAAAIILPIVGLFFLVFAIIEDSGYLPRLSFMLDRIFKKMGLSGRAIIPMVLGLGCASMATMVTRTLPTRRERLIATILLSLCIPCSAQIGVILGLLGGTPYVLTAWFLIIVFIFGLVGTLMSLLVPGMKPSFIIEIPPMRFPQVKNVLGKTYARMKWYFLEIVPLFIIASVLIWIGKITGIFDMIVRGIAYPLSLIGLPETAAPSFLFGFFRRDYGAAGLYDLYKQGAFTNNQLLIATVVLTLFLPCITQFLITIKERGFKIGIGISILVLCFAFMTGLIINMILIGTGFNF